MNTFTIVTGIITLLGFVIQIRGMFPEYRRYYTPATIFMLGITIGFGLSSITATNVYLPDNITARNLFGFGLFGGTGLLIFLCFSASLFIKDKDRTSELSTIGSAVSGFFLFLLIFFSSSFFPKPSVNYLTFDEQMELVNSSIKKENYHRALILIEDQKKQLDKTDSRIPALDKIISKLHSSQVSIYDNVLPLPLNNKDSVTPKKSTNETSSQ